MKGSRPTGRVRGRISPVRAVGGLAPPESTYHPTIDSSRGHARVISVPVLSSERITQTQSSKVARVRVV